MRVLWTGVTGILAVAGVLSLISGLALPGAIHALHTSRPWLVSLGLLLLLGAVTEGGYRQVMVTTTAEPRHEHLLRATFDDVLSQITSQRTVRFFDPAHSKPRAERHFRAHFPEIHRRLDAWQKHVETVGQARAAYAVRVFGELDRGGITEPTYDRSAIVRFLMARSRPSLHLAVEEWPDEFPPAQGWTDGSIMIPGVAVICRASPKAPLWETPEQAAAIEFPVRALLRLVRDLDEVRIVGEKQDQLVEFLEVLRAEMLEVRESEVRVTRRCAVCARNLGVRLLE